MNTYEVISHTTNPVGVIGWRSYEIVAHDPRGDFSLSDISSSELSNAEAAFVAQGYTKVES